MFRFFFVTMGFFFVLFMFLTLQSQPIATVSGKTTDQKKEEIDRRIEELQWVKRGYEAKAIRHENLGEIRQFQDKYMLEARRHFQLAEQNRQMANSIQREIDRLEAEKIALKSRAERI